MVRAWGSKGGLAARGRKEVVFLQKGLSAVEDTVCSFCYGEAG